MTDPNVKKAMDEFIEWEQSLSHDYINIHINAIVEHIEELEDDELDKLIWECTKELCSREAITEEKYVSLEFK